eukprot:Sdes_comp9315_c0_seq1m804
MDDGYGFLLSKKKFKNYNSLLGTIFFNSQIKIDFLFSAIHTQTEFSWAAMHYFSLFRQWNIFRNFKIENILLGIHNSGSSFPLVPSPFQCFSLPILIVFFLFLQGKVK